MPKNGGIIKGVFYDARELVYHEKPSALDLLLPDTFAMFGDTLRRYLKPVVEGYDINRINIAGSNTIANVENYGALIYDKVGEQNKDHVDVEVTLERLPKGHPGHWHILTRDIPEIGAMWIVVICKASVKAAHGQIRMDELTCGPFNAESHALLGIIRLFGGSHSKAARGQQRTEELICEALGARSKALLEEIMRKFGN